MTLEQLTKGQQELNNVLAVQLEELNAIVTRIFGETENKTSDRVEKLSPNSLIGQMQENLESYNNLLETLINLKNRLYSFTYSLVEPQCVKLNGN